MVRSNRMGIHLFCGAAVALAMIVALPSSAALVELDIYVTYSILDNTALEPLADGSFVEAVGSTDGVYHGMATYGGTGFIANSALGNDAILGSVYIGNHTHASTGNIFETLTCNTADNIRYVYHRHFESHVMSTGLVYRGQSAVYNLSLTNYGVVTIDAASVKSPVASNDNNFVIVPEPTAGGMVILGCGLLLAFYKTGKKNVEKGGKPQK